MKRTLILLVLFLLLGGAAYKYLNSDLGGGTGGGEFEKQFAVENPNEIYKIFIADRQGNNTTLERKDGYWLYNNEYRARPNAVTNILKTFANVRVKYRPPKSALPHMVQNLATFGVKVELFDKAGKHLKVAYIGGNTNDGSGTFMVLEGSDEPMVVYEPNWVGSLLPKFTMRGDEWRDRNIFGEQPEEFQSMTLQYHDASQIHNSFRLERTGKDEFSVKPFYETTPVINKPVNQGMVESFLVKFDNKIAEAFENKREDKEEILSRMAFCTFTIQKKNGEEKIARFFPVYKDPKSMVDDKTGETITTSRSVFRYNVEVNGKDFYLVQQPVFGELFWSYNLFFK